MDIRTIRSRKAIIQAGLKLFIQNEDSTLVDIAKAADVGRATLYRQFKTREDLQECIGLHCLDRFDEVNVDVEAQARNPMDALRLILQNLLPLYPEFTFLSKFEVVLKRCKTLKSRMREQDDELRDLISLNLQQGFISDEYSVDWVFFFFEGLLWTGYQAIRSGHCDSAQAATLAFQTFVHGVSYKTN